MNPDLIKEIETMHAKDSKAASLIRDAEIARRAGDKNTFLRKKKEYENLRGIRFPLSWS